MIGSKRRISLRDSNSREEIQRNPIAEVGWRVQHWESSLQQAVLHPIFRNLTSSMGGLPPMQIVIGVNLFITVFSVRQEYSCESKPKRSGDATSVGTSQLCRKEMLRVRFEQSRKNVLPAEDNVWLVLET
ncbi:hypothetical protein Lal_00015939 [Lupinus albus]|nr:hypothetical protein Lal_00015939 [Lupinus albus]